MKFLFILLTAVVAAVVSFAGTTGKITGTVKDSQTGEPVVGASVVVEGTKIGAATDIEGYYVVLNVPPGTYQVSVSAVGYSKKNVAGIAVSVDLTTKCDVTLASTLVEGEEITVTAERNAVKKDLTSSESRVDASQIETLPVAEVSEVLALQAGITVDRGGAIHIRGGRSSEVAYWVDGVSVSDVYDGSQAVQVDNASVQELQVISGTFNAEYGQAMSGVVNIVTKDGDQQYRGNLMTYFGDYVTGDEDIFYDLDDVNPFDNYNIEGSLSGPIPGISALTFYASARYFNSNGHLYGNRVYNTDGSLATEVDTVRDAAGNQLAIDPPNNAVSMNDRERISGQAKLTYQFGGGAKFSLSGLASDIDYRDYSQDWKYLPDGDVRKFDKGYSVAGLWTHSLGSASLYTINLSYFNKSFDEYLYEDPLDPRYLVNPDPALYQKNINEYNKYGTNNHRFKRETETRVAKIDYSDQISKLHLLKIGVEGRLHRLYLEDYNLFYKQVGTSNQFAPAYPDPYGPSYQQYTEQPIEISAYIQDKLEYESMIVNIGLRVDYFNSQGQLPVDPQDPNAFNPAKDENRVDLNNDGVKSDEEQLGYVTDANGNLVLVDPNFLPNKLSRWYKDATPKYSVSPRLGISYPITDRGVLHFSYGHFLQIPSFSTLFQNPGYKVQPTVPGVQGVYGNPDLKAQTTIMYELGLQQQTGEDVTLDLTGFYRDVRDWVQAGPAIPVRDPATAISSYTMYVNKDYANVRGITFSVSKRPSNMWSLNFSYTFQVAEGINSNPDDEQAALLNNSQPSQQLVPLDWDQTHTANLTVGFGSEDWGIFGLARYGSGLPYTPVINQAEGSGQDVNRVALRNNRRQPSTYTIDLRAFKNVELGALDLSFFIKVFNLLDRRNETTVYGQTGRATATPEALGLPSNSGANRVNTIQDYLNQPGYYSEPREIQFGVDISF